LSPINVTPEMVSKGIKVLRFEVEKTRIKGHAQDDLNLWWGKPLKNWDRKIFEFFLNFLEKPAEFY
jgi:hypothetical protein